MFNIQIRITGVSSLSNLEHSVPGFEEFTPGVYGYALHLGANQQGVSCACHFRLTGYLLVGSDLL